MNVVCGVRARFRADTQSPALVRVTASSRYRVYANGLFAGMVPRPARTAITASMNGTCRPT